jgi:hypothetical protein
MPHLAYKSRRRGKTRKGNKMLDEMLSHSEWIEIWKQTHANIWRRYDRLADNECALLESVQKYRSCETGCARGLADVRASLVRTDGGNEETDRIETQQHKPSKEAALDAAVIITDSDYSYAASLSLRQLSEAYYASPEFARKYGKLQREYGFGPVPTVAQAAQR